ncbi:Cytochrome P450 2L1 [Frankliniella fusca]|uniref:Cytochrome P450 2L1 n=1 Tax=Frankliniella fusca TaxID=407009 RepID=A0AAE1I1Z8_9NEOP|nr:Cytochrome P450 2L1 [Frankliniella fusca]
MYRLQIADTLQIYLCDDISVLVSSCCHVLCFKTFLLDLIKHLFRSEVPACLPRIFLGTVLMPKMPSITEHLARNEKKKKKKTSKRTNHRVKTP